MRILIVEDELLLAMDLHCLLNELGYENVYLAQNISRAFELFDAIHPDFAILDVNIGGDLVFPFATNLVSHNVPFVFSTGVRPETFSVEWQNYAILSKPVIGTQLDVAMRSLAVSHPILARR